MLILTLSRLFDVYSTRRLVEEGQSRGHIMTLWDPEWPVKRFTLKPDVLIPRLGNFRFNEALKSLEALQERSAFTANRALEYQQARNKYSSYECMNVAGIVMPLSQLLRREEVYSDNFEFPFVVKVLESSKGEGVYLVKSLEELKILREKLQQDLLVQESIPESFGEDVRAFVVNNRVVACMKRTARAGEFRSNIALGGTGEITSLSSGEEELILKSTKSLNLQIAGIDLLRTNKGPRILEANPCPGFEGLEKYTQQNLAHSIILSLEENYNHGSPPR